MARYIDADMLKELIDGGYDIDFSETPETKAELLNMIDYQDTADVRENVRGEWIDWCRLHLDGTFCWHRACSICGYERNDDNPDKDTNFCPNCGADMRW